MNHDHSPERPDELAVPIWMLVSLVLVLTFAAYLGSLNFQFVFDDRGQIVENPAVHSWGYVRQYFTAHVWAHMEPDQPGNYYRPVFLLWLRLNDMLFGSHPAWWHLTTILAHLATTLGVYFLACRILQDRLTAVITALIFGLHPVHIEAVAWVSGVTEPLLGLLFISSFLCYLRWRDRPKAARGWLAISLALFVLGLLEKETAIVLPALVFANEWISWRSDGAPRISGDSARRFQHALKYAAPFLALVPPYLIARIMVLKGFRPAGVDLPFSTLVFTWPSLGWFWIKHLAWPAGLSMAYDFPSKSSPGWTNFALPLVAVMGALTGLLWLAWRSRPIAFALAWMIAPLIPLLEIRAFRPDDFAHDRYLYLPSVGFAMLAAFALRRIPWSRMTKLGWAGTQTAAVFSIALLMIFGIISQIYNFANNDAFYEYNARAAPNNKIAQSNLAAWMAEKGNYPRARAILTGIVDKDATDWDAVYMLGYTSYKMGRLEEAEQYFIRAVRMNPAKADAHLYLGLTRFRMERVVEAEADIRQAIQIRPARFGYHFALGIILKSRGELTDALSEFRVEAANFPSEAAARQQIMEIEERLQRGRTEK